MLTVATPVDVLRERRGAMGGQRERRRQPLAMPGMDIREIRMSHRAEFEFRANPDSASGPTFSFTGYAATFEQPFDMWDAWGDAYFETLAGGACNRTLSNKCDTQFLIGHNESYLPMARTGSGTMTLAADTRGLLTNAPSLDGRNQQVRDLASALERRDVDEMSIGFIAVTQQWSPDWMERRITEINLNRGDVSIVCWAANPAANGASMVALPVTEAAARIAGVRERRTPTAPYSAKPGESAQCPQCQSMNDADAAYCDQCGTAVRGGGQSTAEENETQRCPCGNWSADDAKFCDQCGTNIASDRDADNGGTGNGATEAPSDYYGWSAHRPGRARRAASPDAEPDFSSAPAQNTAAHGDSSLTCPDAECAAPNAGDSRYCDQCGTCLYDDGGLIGAGDLDDVITDTSGLIEEEDMTLARDRMAMQTRMAELRGRTPRR